MKNNMTKKVAPSVPIVLQNNDSVQPLIKEQHFHLQNLFQPCTTKQQDLKPPPPITICY